MDFSMSVTLCLLFSLLPMWPAAGQDLPDKLTVNVGAVENVGDNVTLALTKRSVRSDTYRLYVQTPEGRKRAEPFPVSTYRGYVQEDPTVRVNANIEPGGILSANFSQGRDIIGHVTKQKIAVPSGTCTPLMSAGNKVIPMSSITARVSPSPGGYTVPPVPMRLVRVALDVAPECIAACPSLEAAVSCAEQRINDADFNWARNVGLAWEINTLVMVVNNPVTGVTWIEDGEEEPAGRKSTVAATFCAAGNGCRGGHAYAAGLGQEAGALMHEAGHTFGCPHGLDKRDAMQGCRAFFGPNNTRVIVANMTHRTEADFPAVTYNGALPPQAQDDVAETTKDKAATIDVLENDFDGNGDTLSLRSVGPTCSEGGAVALTADKMKVMYTPPPGFVGLDSFKYEVVDSSGTASRSGTVDVNVITEGIAAYFDFETVTQGELRGHGSQGFEFKNHGPVGGPGFVFFFKPELVPGVRGNAVFNGINSGWGGSRSPWLWFHQINIPAIGDPGPGDLSVSIWVLYPKLRKNMEGRHKKKVTSTSGVIIGKGAVKFTCDPNQHHPGWAIIHLPKYQGFKFLGSSGGVGFDLQTTEQIQPNTWYHLAMVIDRNAGKLRAWVNDKELSETATTSDIVPGNIGDAQQLRLWNGDIWQYWHSFPAVMDELKIYNTALSAKQVAELYAEGKDARVPDLSALRVDEKAETPVQEEDPRFKAAPAITSHEE